MHIILHICVFLLHTYAHISLFFSALSSEPWLLVITYDRKLLLKTFPSEFENQQIMTYCIKIYYFKICIKK